MFTQILGKPTSRVVHFVGDEVTHAPGVPDSLSQLSSPDHQHQLMVQRFPNSLICTFPPASYKDGHACYQQFLPSCTATGEPLGYRGRDLTASSTLAAELPNEEFWTTVVGYSKGGVVLNKLLAERSYVNSHLGAQDTWKENDKPCTRLLRLMTSFHYVDAGLNCRGVHLTDPEVIKFLGPPWCDPPVQVYLHGTPRQWGEQWS